MMSNAAHPILIFIEIDIAIVIEIRRLVRGRKGNTDCDIDVDALKFGKNRGRTPCRASWRFANIAKTLPDFQLFLEGGGPAFNTFLGPAAPSFSGKHFRKPYNGCDGDTDIDAKR